MISWGVNFSFGFRLASRSRSGGSLGKYKGRKPTVAAQKEAIEALLAAGVGPSEASRRLGIARSSVYRTAGVAAKRAPLALDAAE
jgi:DNA invertase Pin-like site-specific DNA recombinase